MKRDNGFSSEVWSRISAYQAEGLVPSGWEPNGDSEHDHLGSIEAKAYVTWLHIHSHEVAGMGPEAAREVFLGRGRRERPQEPDRSPQRPAEAPKPAPGWSTPAEIPF
jgi:hypothetical protein